MIGSPRPWTWPSTAANGPGVDDWTLMDWDDQTVIRKKKPTAAEAKSKTVINRAMATGNYEVHKKSNCSQLDHVIKV